MAQPISVITMAIILGKRTDSRMNQYAIKAVKGTELYTITVAIDGPLATTESVQVRLKSTTPKPNSIIKGKWARSSFKRSRLKISKKTKSMLMASKLRQKAITSDGIL